MLSTALREAKLVSNSSEARDAITSGWAKVNSEVIKDLKYELKLSKTEYTLLQVGKKKFRMIKQK
jgi:tyrosyl-tRNA synthetase